MKRRVQKERKKQKKNEGKGKEEIDKEAKAKELRNFGTSLYLGCIVCAFLILAKGWEKRSDSKEKKGNGKTNEKGRGRRKKRKESKRLNQVIFLICAFLVTLSIHAGVLTKQTVKLFSKTVLYSIIVNRMDNKINTIIYFQVYFIIHGLQKYM